MPELDALATVAEERSSEMPFPPPGERRGFPGVVAAASAAIRWRCEQLGRLPAAKGAATPVIDAPIGRDEPLGRFMAFVPGLPPGQRRRQTWPSTVAYLAQLAIHRYAMLGLWDERGFPLREMGVLEAPRGGATAAPLQSGAVPGVRQRQRDPQERVQFLLRVRVRGAVRVRVGWGRSGARRWRLLLDAVKDWFRP